MANADGFTEGERYLAHLCRRSFLSPWSFPNLFTDEGKRSSTSAGHELCDLLVVFGATVVVFSDKSVHFSKDKPVSIAWARWFKKAVAKSAHQLQGADAWLRRYPERIYVDPQCTRRLPIRLPQVADLKIHLVAVAAGAHEACSAHFGGNGLGSLVIQSDLQGDEHACTPFRIGWINPSRRFVHVFDRSSLDAVFEEIDTIADFTAYLEKREAFLTRPSPVIVAPGEEQLLAIYLTHLNSSGEHDFVLPGGQDESLDAWMLDESFWPAMVNHELYRAKKAADRISYGWDRLIEHFAAHAKPEEGVVSPSELHSYIEPCLRTMAEEPRLRRRQLAASFLGLQARAVLGKPLVRVDYSNKCPSRAYVFLVVPRDANRDFAEYRAGRASFLSAYCHVAKLKCPAARAIVGIATEGYHGKMFSEDIILLDTSNWTDDLQEYALQLQRDLGLLLDDNVRKTERRDSEYPRGR